jgi:hypothetical protein
VINWTFGLFLALFRFPQLLGFYIWMGTLARRSLLRFSIKPEVRDLLNELERKGSQVKAGYRFRPFLIFFNPKAYLYYLAAIVLMHTSYILLTSVVPIQGSINLQEAINHIKLHDAFTTLAICAMLSYSAAAYLLNTTVATSRDGLEKAFIISALVIAIAEGVFSLYLGYSWPVAVLFLVVPFLWGAFEQRYLMHNERLRAFMSRLS